MLLTVTPDTPMMLTVTPDTPTMLTLAMAGLREDNAAVTQVEPRFPLLSGFPTLRATPRRSGHATGWSKVTSPATPVIHIRRQKSFKHAVTVKYEDGGANVMLRETVDPAHVGPKETAARRDALAAGPIITAARRDDPHHVHQGDTELKSAAGSG